MISLLRTDSSNPHFIELVQLLDEELAERDGKEHMFYAQYNRIDTIKHAMVAYDNAIPVACGAMKEFDAASVEIKRMYTIQENRGKGLATQILTALEKWAAELKYRSCVLET